MKRWRAASSTPSKRNVTARRGKRTSAICRGGSACQRSVQPAGADGDARRWPGRQRQRHARARRRAASAATRLGAAHLALEGSAGSGTACGSRFSRRRSAARSPARRPPAACALGALLGRDVDAVDQHQVHQLRRQAEGLDRSARSWCRRRTSSAISLPRAPSARQVVGQAGVELEGDLHRDVGHARRRSQRSLRPAPARWPGRPPSAASGRAAACPSRRRAAPGLRPGRASRPHGRSSRRCCSRPARRP